MYVGVRVCVRVFFFYKVGSHTGRQLSLTAVPSMAHRDRMVFTAAWKRRICIPLAADSLNNSTAAHSRAGILQ